MSPVPGSWGHQSGPELGSPHVPLCSHFQMLLMTHLPLGFLEVTSRNSLAREGTAYAGAPRKDRAGPTAGFSPGGERLKDVFSVMLPCHGQGVNSKEER